MLLETLRKQLGSVEPAVFLVEPRILRRVIKLDRRIAGVGLALPHRDVYSIERDRLLVFVDRAELELSPTAELPPHVILLARPDDDATPEPDQIQIILRRYFRLTCHARVHVVLDRKIAGLPSRDAWAAERRGQIGESEFAEIRSVLSKDEQLFPEADDAEVYVEFAATYLELLYFAAEQLPFYFPAVRDWNEIDRIVSQDIDPVKTCERLRLEAPSAGEISARRVRRRPLARAAARFRRPSVSLAEFRKLQARAESYAVVGNGIRAALSHMTASRLAPRGYAAEAHAAARGELRRFAARLCHALELPESETDKWRRTLEPLLAPAAEEFWSTEARLLYDLQKVCVEQERGIYRLDLIEWLRTRGGRPIRRPLPLLRATLTVRHLRAAKARVGTSRLGRADREPLAAALAATVEREEHRLRDKLRPSIGQVLEGVGLIAENVPEQVARRKVIEELLDRIVESGYLSMADLRDALSKNDLKLPDVTSVRDLAEGDRLLRADRGLDDVLDGVYRRGAIYQRWPQRLGSLAFGTNLGRWLTRYVAIPFGGAFLILAFFHHLVTPGEPVEADPVSEAVVPANGGYSLGFYSGVVFLGIWLLLLIHSEPFRTRCWKLARRAWRIGRQVLVEWPAGILRSEAVQRVLHSPVFVAAKNYVIVPALWTGAIWLALRLFGQQWMNQYVIQLFLLVALLLNSTIGRAMAERATDDLTRTWHELRIKVFAAALKWIMELFQSILTALERLVYTVDEWLRFRSGDNRAIQLAKLVGGVLWFFVSYVIVFVFTLLVEPQINPIKHFPVVTVAHKLILPTGPAITAELAHYLGKAEAATLVVATIWLIPGVFGFLVWELKENWRLYRANRSPNLRPMPIGKHGETIVQLLRPGFHSGTLPKAFTQLRRAARKSERGADTRGIQRRRIAIDHVEAEIKEFLERELLALLEEAKFPAASGLGIGTILAATNRVDVEIRHDLHPHEPTVVTWLDTEGVLTGEVTRNGWLAHISPDEQTIFLGALSGVLVRAGAESLGGPTPTGTAPVVTWNDWTRYWTAPASAPAAPRLEASELVKLSPASG